MKKNIRFGILLCIFLFGIFSVYAINDKIKKTGHEIDHITTIKLKTNANIFDVVADSQSIQLGQAILIRDIYLYPTTHYEVLSSSINLGIVNTHDNIFVCSGSFLNLFPANPNDCFTYIQEYVGGLPNINATLQLDKQTITVNYLFTI